MLFITVALFLSFLLVPDCLKESTFPVPTSSIFLSLKNPYYQFQLLSLFFLWKILLSSSRFFHCYCFNKSFFPFPISFIVLSLNNPSFQFQLLSTNRYQMVVASPGQYQDDQDGEFDHVDNDMRC